MLTRLPRPPAHRLQCRASSPLAFSLSVCSLAVSLLLTILLIPAVADIPRDTRPDPPDLGFLVWTTMCPR